MNPFADPFDAGALLVLALFVLRAVVELVRWLKRRAALRKFAATHGLRFAGICVPDKREPYNQFESVRGGVLLSNVIEGAWRESQVAVFDYRPGKTATCTDAILSLPRELSPFRVTSAGRSGEAHAAADERRRGWKRVNLENSTLASAVVVTAQFPESAAAAVGPRTSSVLSSGPRMMMIEAHFGYLLVSTLRQVPAEELQDFLDFASSVAGAVTADAPDL